MNEFQSKIEPLPVIHIANNVEVDALKNDPASCFCVTEKHIIVGTVNGRLYISSVTGVVVSSFKCDSSAIRQISVDSTSEYFGCCSEDGKICLSSLCSVEKRFVKQEEQSPKCIQLDPAFNQHGLRRYVLSFRDMVVMRLRKTGIFGSNESNFLLYEGKGPILALQWRYSYILWSTQNSVVLYDVQNEQMVSVIHSETLINLPQDKFPYYISWYNHESFLIGHANELKFCYIYAQSDSNKYVRYSHSLKLSKAIAGVAIVSDKTLAVLTYDSLNVTIPDTSKGPIVYLYTLGSDEYSFKEEIFGGVLPIEGVEYSNLFPSNFDFVSLREEKSFFVLSPMTLFQIKFYNRHDDMVTMDYIEYLVGRGELDAAVEQVPKYTNKSAKRWQEIILLFRSIKKMDQIVKLIPTESPLLEPEYYEIALTEIFNFDYDLFDYLLDAWPQQLFSTMTIQNMVRTQLSHKPTNNKLIRINSNLHLAKGEYDKAFEMYLKLHRADVFNLIAKYNLQTHSVLRKYILELMQCDSKATSEMFAMYPKVYRVQEVLRQIEGRDEFVFRYLDRMFKRDPKSVVGYCDRLVALYIEYDRDGLLPFLKANMSHCRPEQVMKLCKENNQIEEVIFVLDYSGQSRGALKIIVDDLGDIEKAIEFCVQKNELGLWQSLIYSANKPSFIKVLLDNVGVHIDPLLLIEHIPSNVKIPRMRDSLVTIMRDFKVQNELQSSVNEVVRSDHSRCLKDAVNKPPRGISICKASSICAHCNSLLIANIPALVKPVVLFACRHSFHESCVRDTCPICHKQKR